VKLLIWSGTLHLLEEVMRGDQRSQPAARSAAILAGLLCAVLAASSVAFGEDAANSGSNTRPAPAQPAPAQPAPSQPAPATPEITVLDKHEVEGVLGREVLSATNENMGRIVDVLVDRTGQVRAAIIDFGGFLGVGSRKIAVDWNALHFPPPGKAGARIALELTRDQVKAAPEYQEGKPVVVLGALGKLESLPFAD
jgi:PRC-barrel domain